MKKTITVILSMFILFSFLTVATADSPYSSESVTSYRYIGLYNASTNLSITGNTARCNGSAFAKSPNYSLKVTLSLQKSMNGSWSTIVSWKGTGTGYVGVVLSETSSGLSSGTYRCKMYVRVYDSNGIFVESSTVFSQTCSI